MKKVNKKTLIIAAVAVAVVLLSTYGVKIIELFRPKEVFRQMLTETAQKDADELFGKSDKYSGPLMSIYTIFDHSLLDSEGNPVTQEALFSASTELSLYQSKVNDMVKDISEYRIGDIVIQEKDPSYGNMDTADVTVVFKWYDFSSVISEFNKRAYNQLLPYLLAHSDRTFPVIDKLMLSILEKVEAAGMTREYKAVYRYALSEGGSNPFTGKGARWSQLDPVNDKIREMILKELNYADNFKDEPSEEELNTRKDISVNMAIAVDLYGRDETRELLESIGYEALVSKMISEHSPEESPNQ